MNNTTLKLTVNLRDFGMILESVSLHRDRWKETAAWLRFPAGASTKNVTDEQHAEEAAQKYSALVQNLQIQQSRQPS